MKSEAFDKSIRDKIEELDMQPLAHWDASSVWNKLEEKRCPKRVIPWGKLAIAASLLLLFGTMFFMFHFSWQQKQRELLSIKAEKNELQQQLKQMNEKMHEKLTHNACNVEDTLPQKIKMQPRQKEKIIPIQIHQLPIVIYQSKRESQLMALRQMNTSRKPVQKRHKKILRKNVEIISGPQWAAAEGNKIHVRFGQPHKKTSSNNSSRPLFTLR